ncbi:bifunctional alpha/beta hydrolase/OsmC family protein [Pseudorhodoplanes sp.]|uniref:bifunctional alpha/beta hydrolase/OsmC family protein n=1 Tax=Pseudorhodoplanes sp. TaxID=1934341 RepID=UPI003D0F5DD2
MPAERFDFPNDRGERLSALLDKPEGTPCAYALFAHCFTCGKDAHAARRIAAGLTALGIAVLRFDFTGLGSSEGEFANTTFSSNVADLVAAARHLRDQGHPPALLIGHSLGGAAIIAAAPEIAEARAVVTVAAPADPTHVTHLFRDQIDVIRESGEIEVSLGGRPFRIKREFLDDIETHKQAERIAKLRKALLIFHSPTDEIVGIDNATAIFVAAKHPKSFVSLAGADHLLSRKEDSAYVANVIAAWAGRYLEMPAPIQTRDTETEAVIVTETGIGKFQQTISAGHHVLTADEPIAQGGEDSGPNPYDLLLAGLGACTSMTLRHYADRIGLPLERVSVALKHSRIHAADCEACETKEGKVDRIDRVLTLKGNLDSEQRKRLLEIADKCPVHRTLTSEIDIRTVESG